MKIQETLKEKYFETEDKNDYVKLKGIKKDFRDIDIISLKYIILSVFPRCSFIKETRINNNHLINIIRNIKQK